MPRASLVLGIALMLAVAGAANQPARESEVAGLQSQDASSLAAGMACLNCSDLALGVASPSTTLPLQPTGPSAPLLAFGTTWSEEGSYVWRGKNRSRWESVGFGPETFELFMTMKGAGTRLSLLSALSEPKDRMRLAQELSLDWKAVDYHMIRLNRAGLVGEDRAYGKVKLYRLTTLGETLLRLVREPQAQTSTG